jgi:malate dehydrogenase (oxaloacetate-decarboxylating)
MDIFKESLQAHLNARGKIEVKSKVPLNDKHDLSLYYSPGVASSAEYVAKHPNKARLYTSTNNTVAIISDGSAVLGLGNIGPLGALPVMEGKAILFKKFADIDGIPIVLNTQDPDEIIETIVRIAPSFGGINLEDIASPNCFYIEEELKKRLNMPIMHDDQHGTAIVVLAGLINAVKVTKRKLNDCKIVMVGAGAAGVAIAKIIHSYAPNANIVAVDSKGVININRTDLTYEKKLLAGFGQTNDAKTLQEALIDADVFIGVSKANLLDGNDIRKMRKNPIIFALANPNPEILPEEAKKAGVAVIATGRSDYPNQVNNVLAFPGIFRGALDKNVPITEEHKLAAAEALAYSVKNPSNDLIIPDPLNSNIARIVASVF